MRHGGCSPVAPWRALAFVAEELSELRDVDLNAVGRGGRRIVAPERVDEAIAGHDAIALEQEQREHAALLEPAEREHAVFVEDLQRSEHTELDQRSPLGDATTVDRAQAVLKRRPSARSATPATTEG